RGTSRIPLVQNLLRNRDFLRYYLDHLEYVLDTAFNVESFAAQVGAEGSGGLWDRVRQSAYLESDTPYGRPFTGRQFTNDEVYSAVCRQDDLRHGEERVESILRYVDARYDAARPQLATRRKTVSRRASGP